MNARMVVAVVEIGDIGGVDDCVGSGCVGEGASQKSRATCFVAKALCRGVSEVLISMLW
jgi:hypothetical protein